MGIKQVVILFFSVFYSYVIAQGEKPFLHPNIIFILADDQPYDYLGCTGNEIIKTPNIDKLAEEGVLFTNAHVTSAICTPSRVSIFLSQFERKHGVNFNSGTSVSEKAWDNSYPKILKKNGYYTGYVGKNHSPIGEGGYSSGVIESSFDYWYAGHGHLGFYPKERHEIFIDALSETQIEILNEGTSKFLDSVPDEKPFCLTVCYNLPHSAGTSTMRMKDSDPEIYKSLYRDLEIPLPQEYVAKKDIKKRKLPVQVHHSDDRQEGYNFVDTPETLIETYIRQLQTTTGIDIMVGNIRSKLKKLGIDKNTIIIYSSDHGIMMGQHGLGGKALCYEPCTKVPLIIYNPISKTTLRESEELVQTIDIAPTILSYAGIPSPSTFQGINLESLINKETITVRNYLFTENLWSTQFGNPYCEAVQTKEWKYIRYYQNNNFSARKKIEVAKMMGIDVNKMLYTVHDPDIATYRSYIEAPFSGERAVYEELFNLYKDPNETTNLVTNKASVQILNKLRTACDREVQKARGEGKPDVIRYTHDSKIENKQKIIHE